MVTYSDPAKKRLHNLPRTDLVDHITRLQKQLAVSHDESDRRLALLRRYEWIDVFIDNGGYGDKWIKQCLCCKSERDDGHADDCELAKELKDG